MPHGKSAKGMFDGIGKTLHDLQPIAKQFGAALGGVLKNVAPILTQVAGIIGKNLGPFIKLVAEFVVKHLLPALQQFGAFVSKTIMPIVNTLVDVFMKDVMPTVLNLASAFTDKLLPPLENIMSHVLPVLNPLFKFLGWIFSNIIGPVLGFIIGLIGKFLDALSWLIDKVSHVGDAFQKFGDLMRNIWNGVVGGVKGFINMILGWVNDLIGALDSIQVTIPSWVPIFGGTTFGLHIPKIPLLAEGGDITQAGTAIVGERGPELLSLPQGARVTPLSHSTAPTGLPAGMAAYGLASASQGGSDLPVHIFLDGRKVAEVVVKHTPSVVRNSTGTRSF
jgi:phage-related protein